MRSLRTYFFPLCLGVCTCALILADVFSRPHEKSLVLHQQYREGTEWIAPAESEIPSGREGEAIRYGRELIANTAIYLGPKGAVAPLTNGMNCQNCHTYAGTQAFGNPFSAVASTYPRYRDRSGRVESVEFRINDCLQRSLNGKPIDSLSREMQAMVAYIKWVGSDVPKGIRPKGAGAESLPLLDRPSDAEKGRKVFALHCQRCHGTNGEGVFSPDSSAYVYPPLWGEHSYNTGAGIYRLGFLAGFIKANMPYGTIYKEPALSNEQAWDVAAFIASQPRPVKTFSSDWKDITKKPVDYPFGPYSDSFSEQQHKFGPFGPIKK